MSLDSQAQVRVSAGSPLFSGLTWSLYKCAALRRVVYGTSAIESPWEYS